MLTTHSDDNQHYLKPGQAAVYLNTSTSTLAKRRLYGRGPKFSRIGRAVRYSKSDLDEFMAASRAASTFGKATS